MVLKSELCLASQDESFVASMLPLIAIFIAMYFLIIRPQSIKAKELQGVIASIQKGDEIEFNDTFVAKVVEITDELVRVELSNNNFAFIKKSGITKLLPKGTLKL